MGKPNRGGLGKPLGWGEGWKGSRSAADSHILFLAIRREFGGHKNFVLHPSGHQLISHSFAYSYVIMHQYFTTTSPEIDAKVRIFPETTSKIPISLRQFRCQPFAFRSQN
jgi:hypothetical protein